MTFETPILLWLLAVLPLVALYRLLFQKLPVQVVPCLALWTGGKSFKVRRRILPALPGLLLLASIILALANPVIDVEGGRPVIVLDNSASMLTEEAGGTRFAIALDTVYRYSSRGDVAIVLSSPRPSVLSLHSGPRTPAGEQELSGILCAGAAKPQQALDVAHNLLDPGAPLVVITDGAGPAWREALGKVRGREDVKIHIVGEAVENVGLCLKEVYRGEDGINTGIEVTNYGPSARDVRLLWQGVSLPDTTLSLPPFETVYRRFPLPANARGECVCRLQGKEPYATDDGVRFGIPALKKARVLLVTDRPRPYLLSALAAYPELVDKQASAVAASSPAQGEYDLAVVCKNSEDLPPAKNLLLWGVDPPVPAQEIRPSTCFWGTGDHPLARHLRLSGLRFRDARGYGARETDRIIAHGNEGPIMWEGRQGDLRYIYVTFALENSQFPLMPSFPVFIHNAILWSVGDGSAEKTDFSETDGESDIAPAPLFHERFVPLRQGKQYVRAALLIAALACCAAWGLFRFFRMHRF